MWLCLLCDKVPDPAQRGLLRKSAQQATSSRPSRGHLPHQLLVVQGQGRLPAEDVHLALEDRQLHLPFHPLLGLGYTMADKFTLGAVPETCREGRVRAPGRPQCCQPVGTTVWRGWGTGGTPQASCCDHWAVGLVLFTWTLGHHALMRDPVEDMPWYFYAVPRASGSGSDTLRVHGLPSPCLSFPIFEWRRYSTTVWGALHWASVRPGAAMNRDLGDPPNPK